MSDRAKTITASPTGMARLRRHLLFLKPARWYFVGGLLAGLVFALATGVGMPLMFKLALPVIFGQPQKPPEIPPKLLEVARVIHLDGFIQKAATSLNLETIARNLFGDDYQNKLLLTACLFLPLIFLVRAAGAFLNRYWLNKMGFIALENMRVAVFRRLQELPLAFYQQQKSGDLMARLMNDTEQLRQVVVKTSGEIIKQPLTLVAAVIYLVLLSLTEKGVVFTLVVMLSVPLCVIPIRLAAKRLRKRSAQLMAATGDLTATVTETLQAPLEIQAFNLQAQQTARFSERVRGILRLSMKTVYYQAITSPAIEVVSAMGFVAALYFGRRAGMDYSTFMSLVVVLWACYEPMKQLSNLHGFLKMGEASLDRLEYVLDAEDSVPPPAQPKALPPATAPLEFRNVTFQYATRAGDAPPALSEVNLTIEPGEIVALVGASGAGKSTFAMLVPRFYDPTAGQVACGGVDLRDLDKAAWRERIAIVPQMPALFNATIAENIRMGRLSATDDEIREAAQKAFIADFIAGLPQGYETLVGERGASLSGGQRQRIAIARAFLKNAPILILDEATSALDSESEAMVSRALAELMRGRTTVMIAHRFSSISLARRILVFEAGRITGDGSPDALAQSHPGYRRMVELQKLG
jgi:subfamily B ATP-binding cassette protein MsbA